MLGLYLTSFPVSSAAFRATFLHGFRGAHCWDKNGIKDPAKKWHLPLAKVQERRNHLNSLNVQRGRYSLSFRKVNKARRLTLDGNVGWEITVDASGNSDVTITLSATTDCSAQGAVCIHSGKKLCEGLELTVSGPGR